MTTDISILDNSNDGLFTHRTPAEVIAHLRTKQGKRVYHSVVAEIRDMALGGDAGETGGGISIREYYYPHFSDEDFCEILRGLGEGINVG